MKSSEEAFKTFQDFLLNIAVNKIEKTRINFSDPKIFRHYNYNIRFLCKLMKSGIFIKFFNFDAELYPKCAFIQFLQYLIEEKKYYHILDAFLFYLKKISRDKNEIILKEYFYKFPSDIIETLISLYRDESLNPQFHILTAKIFIIFCSYDDRKIDDLFNFDIIEIITKKIKTSDQLLLYNNLLFLNVMLPKIHSLKMQDKISKNKKLFKNFNELIKFASFYTKTITDFDFIPKFLYNLLAIDYETSQQTVLEIMKEDDNLFINIYKEFLLDRCKFHELLELDSLLYEKRCNMEEIIYSIYTVLIRKNSKMKNYLKKYFCIYVKLNQDGIIGNYYETYSYFKFFFDSVKDKADYFSIPANFNFVRDFSRFMSILNKLFQFLFSLFGKQAEESEGTNSFLIPKTEEFKKLVKDIYNQSFYKDGIIKHFLIYRSAMQNSKEDQFKIGLKDFESILLSLKNAMVGQDDFS
jgi:hypothetical protein